MDTTNSKVQPDWCNKHFEVGKLTYHCETQSWLPGEINTFDLGMPLLQDFVLNFVQWRVLIMLVPIGHLKLQHTLDSVWQMLRQVSRFISYNTFFKIVWQDTNKIYDWKLSSASARSEISIPLKAYVCIDKTHRKFKKKKNVVLKLQLHAFICTRYTEPEKEHLLVEFHVNVALHCNIDQALHNIVKLYSFIQSKKAIHHI